MKHCFEHFWGMSQRCSRIHLHFMLKLMCLCRLLYRGFVTRPESARNFPFELEELIVTFVHTLRLPGIGMNRCVFLVHIVFIVIRMCGLMSGVPMTLDLGGVAVTTVRPKFSALRTVDSNCFRHLFSALSVHSVIRLVGHAL